MQGSDPVETESGGTTASVLLACVQTVRIVCRMWSVFQGRLGSRLFPGMYVQGVCTVS
jgi:hypothetical protein